MSNLTFKTGDDVGFNSTGQEMSGCISSVNYDDKQLMVSLNRFWDCQIDFSDVNSINGNIVIAN